MALTLQDIVDDEFLQPLRGAITKEQMIATRQMIESLRLESNITPHLEQVKVFCEDYILLLRDGEQYTKPPDIKDIELWVAAKGLEGILEPYAVLATILTEGTTWDRKGGSVRLQEVISDDNLKRIMNIAVEQKRLDLKQVKWLSR